MTANGRFWVFHRCGSGCLEWRSLVNSCMLPLELYRMAGGDQKKTLRCCWRNLVEYRQLCRVDCCVGHGCCLSFTRGEREVVFEFWLVLITDSYAHC